MPPKNKGHSFYAVKRGKVPGIYSTWAECEAQTKGFSNPAYKKFTMLSDAEAFISGASSSSSSKVSLSEASPSSDHKSKKRAFGPEVDDITGWDIVYSDGACKGNGKVGSVAGIGVWWGHDDIRNIAERCPGDQTNNRAELIAILRVLEETPRTRTPLLIRTDSQYSINCFKNWIANWRKNDWKTASGGPVKNDGIIRCISAHLDIRGKQGQKVVLEYVKGHSGDTGNDGADAMANKGATLPILNERPWMEIEDRLLQQLSDMDVQPKTPVAKLIVLAPDNLTEGGIDNMEAPTKVRKLSASHSPSLKDRSVSPPKTVPGKVISRSSNHQSSFSSETKTLESSASSHPNPPLPSVHTNSTETSPLLDKIASQKSELVNKPNLAATFLPNPEQNVAPKASTPSPQKSKPISSLPYISGAKSPLRVIYAQPPRIPVNPVRVEDVNPDDYADCLLDDDELANELN